MAQHEFIIVIIVQNVEEKDGRRSCSGRSIHSADDESNGRLTSRTGNSVEIVSSFSVCEFNHAHVGNQNLPILKFIWMTYPRFHVRARPRSTAWNKTYGGCLALSLGEDDIQKVSGAWDGHDGLEAETGCQTHVN